MMEGQISTNLKGAEDRYRQTERHIYGSSRLGMETSTVELIATTALSPCRADANANTLLPDPHI